MEMLFSSSEIATIFYPSFYPNNNTVTVERYSRAKWKIEPWFP